MDRSRYFDNAATTPIDPRVKEEMLPFLGEEFGNANSLHEAGRRAAQAVELARERVASLLRAEDPSQIIFTSGATEANNWIINAFSSGAISPFEHSAVREPAIAKGLDILRNVGLEVCQPDETVELISLMSVNNEIGSRWDPLRFRAKAKVLHSDITQQAGKTEVNLDGIDFASLSAHKFYGPKGVGALYAQSFPPDPLLRGGEQESGHRSGTLNVTGIVGMGVAAAIADQSVEEDEAHAAGLKHILLEELSKEGSWQLWGGESASPYILAISFDGIEGESLVIALDNQNFAISAGAACSSRSTEPSHVLMTLGLSEREIRGTVRISFGRYNSKDSTREIANALLHSAEILRTMC
jgi:cysteine desulfurase